MQTASAGFRFCLFILTGLSASVIVPSLHRAVHAAAPPTPASPGDSPAAATSAAKAAATRPQIDFQREIRPILADTCYTCHGPDKAKRDSDLRLDTHAGAMADLGGHQAIVPGKPQDSEMFRRIISTDPDERMPPPKSGRQLTANQIELLRRWITEGAVWKEHWAFVRPERPADPEVKLKAWPRTTIDRFVLAQLEQQGLSPSPEASKETLIRRVTLDLTGLPPTVAEVDAFVADSSPAAYANLVDRLLASPRYGEHMAAQWLDAARYSDTNGYQVDGTRTMWPWRDWVVEALNRNQPFDQFTIEQLAGDLLPKATDRQKLATGFNRNHPLNGEGGRVPEESRVEYVVDRVDATATIWLGMTAGCARCHDHKYDPISQREFYQLYAFFNNVAETGGVDKGSNASPVMSIRLEDPRLAKLTTEIAELESQLEAGSADLSAAESRWESTLKVNELAALDLEPWEALGPLQAGNGESAFAKDFGPESNAPIDTPDANAASAQGGAKWQPKLLADGELHPLDLPANAAIYLARTITATRARELNISLGSDDGIKVWLDGKLLLAKNIIRGAKPDQDKLLLKLHEGKNRLLIKIHNGSGPSGFYFAAASTAPTREVVDALRRPTGERNAVEREAVSRYFRSVAPEGKKLRDRIAALRKKQTTELKQTTLDTMIMQERPDPRKTFVLIRGQWDAPDNKQQVQAEVPSCLPALPSGAPHNRLGLARWLVDPANPLTARVTVNRFWQQFFGLGLVRTPEDFGSQGEPPTNPALLDWLATEFVAKGWDVKAMHRQIVTSATYRQSSRATPELLERDPYNLLLARGPRYRLSAMALRDQALALSGLLVEKVGGAPVMPYQPAGVWLDFSLGKIDYEQGHGDALYRRSLYTFWRRSVAPTMLFDVSPRQVCTVRPSRTNTPLHALTLLNDVTYVEAARKLAGRILSEADAAPQARLNRAFRMATARQPQSSEIAVLLSSLNRARNHFRAQPEAAKKLLTMGESPNDGNLDPVELAAYTSVMNIVLNLDEVLTKE
ncbi:MAG: PSD1 and planctomycete cytochrome C domain-containing protein [Planctomycetes bacterium]|nr:PSD1 and planctomycete cytochrome C domain-containing protein [Planctomycetota bacterium]